jgi:hypothetical protein
MPPLSMAMTHYATAAVGCESPLCQCHLQQQEGRRSRLDVAAQAMPLAAAVAAAACSDSAQLCPASPQAAERPHQARSDASLGSKPVVQRHERLQQAQLTRLREERLQCAQMRLLEALLEARQTTAPERRVVEVEAGSGLPLASATPHL